jgi:hypothetical protein
MICATSCKIIGAMTGRGYLVIAKCARLTFISYKRTSLRATLHQLQTCSVELARLRFFNHRTAAALLIRGQTCVLCLEDISPGNICILYNCGHGFYDKCAASWRQFEGEEEEEEEGIIGDWQWLKDYLKKTCPCCGAEVTNERLSNERAGLAAMATRASTHTVARVERSAVTLIEE